MAIRREDRSRSARMLPYVGVGAAVGGLAGILVYAKQPQDNMCSTDTDWVGSCLNAPLAFMFGGLGLGAIGGAAVGAWRVSRDTAARQ